jgi:hypothetical protein
LGEEFFPVGSCLEQRDLPIAPPMLDLLESGNLGEAEILREK